jgi:uncharacterized protein (DUF2384 family)
MARLDSSTQVRSRSPSAPLCRRSRRRWASQASTLSKPPSAQVYQTALRQVARMLEVVRDSLPDEEHRRAWLTRPRADMEDASPLDVVLAGEAGAVVSQLEGAQLGIFG